ncbi:MAG: D-alanyl-D-alanine carboxypeptidase/D-alanyl-D-alanine-endopeptidase [Candidatus Amulumruptor caecigallinarius]|nr:D-alanyl-D-alanine carboxypeptidase/D-alanyl-D-alanine-endopeptidase [Candidatus Amulumruptor caecigallinarius]
MKTGRLNHFLAALPVMVVLICMPGRIFADIADFVGSAAIDSASSAVLVVDLKTGRTLQSLNEETPLIPASIMKCVTTATLLEKTGPAYRYNTGVYITGKVRNRVLEGDILVEASGDPSLNTRSEPGSDNLVKEIVEAIANLDIDSIAGDVVVDESRFPGPAINPAWAKGDLPHSYGTGSHGFNFEDNASGKSSVADPAGVFRSRLRGALRDAGVPMSGNAGEHRGKHYPLGMHVSAPVDEIMRSCMMRSDNQYAEALLRTIGLNLGSEGSIAEGAKKVTEYWRKSGADMSGVNVVDGSGLSRSNRVTARFIADVLTKMAGNPYYASFFPLAGQEGTLRKLLTGSPLEGYIAMKTGSMKGIQCYAGYKLDDNYEPTHVVVIMLNNMGDRAAARRQVESLLLETFP